MGSRRESARVLHDPQELDPPFPLDAREQTGSEETIDPLREAEREARNRGYREGRERAAAELARETEVGRRELSAALKRLALLEASLTKSHEARLLEIALEAASRIARTRVEAGDPIAVRALEEALDALPNPSSFRARVHPDDLQPLTDALRAEIDAGRLELIADPDVGRGGTLVECEAGRVDATLETAEVSIRAAVSDGDESP
jgi:flagellar assembly protein FliH